MKAGKRQPDAVAFFLLSSSLLAARQAEDGQALGQRVDILFIAVFPNARSNYQHNHFL
jgi:hypothetical protein